MADFIKTTWALNGQVTAIPETTQPDGAVSMDEGFGPDYSKSLSSDPDAKAIPRRQFNQLMALVTEALQQYQTHGVPDFITTADNGGSPYPYDIGALVRYDPGSGFQVYQSLANTNVELPTNASFWVNVTFPLGTAGLADNAVTLAKLATQASNTALVNATGSSAVPTALAMAASTVLMRAAAGNIIAGTITQLLDLITSFSTRGSLIYRGASTAEALAPGTNGYYLKSNGAGADPSWAAVSSGVIVDRAFASYDSTTSISNVILGDNSIPQISEGTEILSASITPKSVTNRIRITAVVWGSNSTGSSNVTCLAAFLTGQNDALAAVGSGDAQANTFILNTLIWEFVPGTTSPITITCRVGVTSGTFYVNGNNANRAYGTASKSTLVLEEITA